jgi:hypothetical protein
MYESGGWNGWRREACCWAFGNFLRWQTRDVNAFTVPAKTADHANCDSTAPREESLIILHCDLK